MILLVDNYDSFTYNLVHQLPEDCVILRNDHPDLLAVAEQSEAIIFSPGPGYPSEAGKMEEMILLFYQKKPILGICLGHQAIGEVFGATIRVAQKIMHGKISLLEHDSEGLFNRVSPKSPVMRYHSLVIAPETLPEFFEVHGYADQEIMAIKHRDYPLFGLQFHPESIATPEGQKMIDAFLRVVGGVK